MPRAKPYVERRMNAKINAILDSSLIRLWLSRLSRWLGRVETRISKKKKPIR